jgi:hypothetical protein
MLRVGRMQGFSMLRQVVHIVTTALVNLLVNVVMECERSNVFKDEHFASGNFDDVVPGTRVWKTNRRHGMTSWRMPSKNSRHFTSQVLFTRTARCAANINTSPSGSSEETWLSRHECGLHARSGREVREIFIKRLPIGLLEMECRCYTVTGLRRCTRLSGITDSKLWKPRTEIPSKTL